MAPRFLLAILNLAKRGCCNPGFCLCMHMCVRSPISHCNFVKCEPIVTKLYMGVAGYDICIVEYYHGNRSQDKVKVIEIVKKNHNR